MDGWTLADRCGAVWLRFLCWTFFPFTGGDWSFSAFVMYLLFWWTRRRRVSLRAGARRCIPLSVACCNIFWFGILLYSACLRIILDAPL
jgi:hypothetical protein